MFAKLLEAMFGIGSGTSWLDLDERMKGQLRFWGIIAVLVLVLLILSSLYFYVEWTPLKELVDAVLGDVRKSIKDKDAMPPWVLWAGGTWFAVLVVASLIFFYFLFSFGKMHYKIDRVTFRAIPEVGKYIESAILEHLKCPNDPGCSLRKLRSSASGRRQFMNDMFYYFANRDEVGRFNQKDKRRQVFAHWTKYYVFNFIMIICCLCWLWLCFLVFLRFSVWIGIVVAVLAVPAGWFWRSRGTQYRSELRELAADQVRAFFREVPSEMKEQAGKMVSGCSAGGCPFSRIVPA